MLQERLFHLTIQRTEPAPYGSADCSLVGIGDDGLVYILKRTRDGHPLVPATEWICSQLARHVGLPVAPCYIAELPASGELAFASREEGGVLDRAGMLKLLGDPGTLANFAPVLSRWYAFDLFTHNVDRHIGNFLFRGSALGPVLIGIDFSRALLTQGWPGQVPPLPACNTVQVQQALHRMAPYPTASAVQLVDRLAGVDDAWLGDAIHAVPDDWLDAKVKRRITRWWCRSRRKRLRLLRRHLDSGRYLRIFAGSRCP